MGEEFSLNGGLHKEVQEARGQETRVQQARVWEARGQEAGIQEARLWEVRGEETRSVPRQITTKYTKTRNLFRVGI